MTDGNDPKRQDELADLEPMHEEAELEPLPEVPAPAGAPADMAGPGAGRTGPRELERAPLLLQKAAAILIFASLLPWLLPGGWSIPVLIAKVIVLAGGGILYHAVLARHGERVPGPFAALAKLHAKALDGLGWVVVVGGLVVLFAQGLGSFGAVVEVATLAIGIAVWVQILDYEKGGRFNPVLGMVIPLIGLAAVGRLVTLFTAELEVFALLGSLGVLAAALVAGRTLFIAMKEAKAHGEAKKQAAIEARKAARAQQRGASDAPGAPRPGGARAKPE